MASAEEIDLYEVLGISKSATKVEIKKAYHKAALTSHPDKVPVDQREEADIKFKGISQAYEILSDDDNRALYDQHGMAAFEKGAGGAGFPGSGPDLDDILAQMFGGGMGGMPGMGGGFEGMGGFPGAGGPRRRRGKGKSELQRYEVTLEELYKGKTTKFASTKKVICTNCSGSGGKNEKVKAKTCDTCKGRGATTRLQPVGPGMVTQQTLPCGTCNGKGSFYADKDKCKKCKGERTTQQKKILELYVPRGSREGEHVVLAGEADQDPDDAEPGDIVFELVEEQHKTFNRAGADLHAEIEISLSEALTGFNRVVLLHLDGRGIQLNVQQPEGKVIRPDDVLKVQGEGMPIKRSDAKGDLYLTVKINFPEDGWLKEQAAIDTIRKVLPPAHELDYKPGETPEMVDEVQFQVVDSLDGFGADSDDPRAANAEWEDDEEDGAGGAQCAQQ